MKQNLLKTMLVGIAVLAGTVGVTAADTTTLYERGTTGNEWTTDNLSDFSADLTLSDYGAYYTSSNASHEFSKTITIAENAIINVDAYWYGMANTGRKFSQGNGSYFRFGNVFVAQNDQDQLHGYALNGISNMASVTTFKGTNAYRNYDISTKTFLHIEMEINTATNTLNYLRVSEEGSDSYLVDIADQTLESPDYATIAFGYRKSGRVSTSQYSYLKSVKVTETKQEVASANYTINYTYDGNTVSTTTGTLAVGAEVSATSVVTDEEGTKYLIVADEAPTLTVSETEANNVLNVPVRKPYVATVKITNVVGDESMEPTETTFTETDDKVCEWSYAWPLYILKDGAYYKADDTALGENGTFTETTTIERTVKYTTVDSKVVYFGEWETDCTSSGSTYPTSSIEGFSNGKGKAIMKTDQTMSLTFNAAKEGTYEITMPYYNSNTSARRHQISLDDAVIVEDTSVDSKTGGTISYSATLAAGEHTVTIQCMYSLTSVFDYLLVTSDTATGINEINATKNTSIDAVYNLSGQRVAQPVKGLYIVNGKKVVVR